MKTLTSAMLGLTLLIGSAALPLAASQKADDKSTTSPAETPKVKKHHKKRVKTAKPAHASTSASTPTPSPAK